jgi:hypothetical protein
MITCGFEQNGLHPRLAAIDMEVQGAQLIPNVLSSSEVMLIVRYGLQPLGGIRETKIENSYETLRQAHDIERSGSSIKIVRNNDNIVPVFDETVSRRLPRLWLDECDRSHGKRCQTAVKFVGQNEDNSLILVDVIDDNLVHGNTSARYFALSYLWGRVAMYETRKNNYHTRLLPGSLRSPENGDDLLSSTIRDAMTLVRDLGERYLWVDSLCIIQDDAESKYKAIHQMDLVYSRAYSTLVALSGSDASSGLPGVRAFSRPPQMIRIVSEQGDLCTHTPPPLPYLLETSVWDTRGWTFQEKVLSRRCLLFSEYYVHFQCGETVRAETDPGLLNSKKFEQHSEFDLLRDLWQEEVEPGMSSLELTTYFKMVEAYSRRHLSYPVDVLNAFSGVQRVLERHSENRFVYGLPTTALDLALLWTEAEPLSAREVLHRDEETEADFLRWSWAAWVGLVRYTIDQVRRRDKAGYAMPEVEQFQIFHRRTLQTFPVIDRSTDLIIDTLQAKQESIVGVSGPDLGPNVLQFWAWTDNHMEYFRIDTRYVFYLSGPEIKGTESRQGVMRIQDSEGVHCGLLYQTAEMVKKQV